MKIHGKLFLASLFLSTQLFSQVRISDEVLFKHYDKIVSYQELNSGSYENADIFYVHCKWRADPAVRFISGEVESHFISSNDLDSISFDLTDHLTVDSVYFHSAPSNFIHQNDLLRIYFSQTVSAGSKDSVSIFYHGVPPSTGNGSFEVSSHNNVPVLWTLSEPYGAKDWWPCRQNTDDKIDSIAIDCTIPPGNRCASVGILQDVDTTATDVIYKWRSKYPIVPYLAGIAITNYSSHSAGMILGSNDTLTLLDYVYPEDSAQTIQSLSVTPQLISYYDSLLITYPFAEEKYGHAQFGWGGGIEHQTMSFVGSFNFELIAHELAHQWFGDLITSRHWNDIWLQEGFATYLAGMAIERFHPEEWYAWKSSALANVISQADGSVYCPDTNDIARIFNGRLSYRKAALVLHMLRFKIGDTAFVQGMKNFLSDPVLKYDFAITENLQTHFEIASGTNLDEFFSEWIYGEGFPVFKVRWEKQDGGIIIRVNQSTTHSSVPFFHIPLPLLLSNNENDTIIFLQQQSSDAEFSIAINFVPDNILIDPDLRIISGRNSVIETTGNNDDQVLVFPNPSDGKIKLVSRKTGLRMMSIEVFGITGNLLHSRNLSHGFEEEIDLSDLPGSVYLLGIRAEDGIIYKKLFIR